MAKKILLVDDDRTNVRMVQTRLEKEGYFVITAFDGDAGLQKVQVGNPDLIVLDVEMPEMNGYTFMLELQKLKDFKDLPVIILTTHQAMEPIFKFNGVRGYIVKPVDFDRLLQLMTSALG